MTLLLAFLAIFVMNAMPAFMPPTWMAISAAAVALDTHNIFPLVVIGALAATLGRAVLALASTHILRDRLLAPKYRTNIDEIRKHLENRQALTVGVFLFYAFGPLPSNQLFIAYGLTKLPLRLIVAPFFIGRLISYTIYSWTTVTVADQFAFNTLATGSFMTSSFILSQLLVIATLYYFAKIDWHHLFAERSFRMKK